MRLIKIWYLWNTLDENEFRLIIHDRGRTGDAKFCRVNGFRIAATHATAEHGEDWRGDEIIAPCPEGASLSRVINNYVQMTWCFTDASRVEMCSCMANFWKD